MDGWVIGLIVLCVVGLGVIIFGALADRRMNQRRAAQLLNAPARPIPQFIPGTQAPHYLSELMSHRAPEGPGSALSDTERAMVRGQLGRAVQLGSGYASADFITDPASGWAVLDRPRVLVCAEAPGSFREVLGVLEKMVLRGTPLVIAAPPLPEELVATLGVNCIQRRAEIVAVCSADPSILDQAAAATSATLVSRIDLQAGYVTDAHLGECERWVSDSRHSWVIGPRS